MEKQWRDSLEGERVEDREVSEAGSGDADTGVFGRVRSDERRGKGGEGRNEESILYLSHDESLGYSFLVVSVRAFTFISNLSSLC